MGLSASTPALIAASLAAVLGAAYAYTRAALAVRPHARPAELVALPPTLRATGLYADPEAHTIAPGILRFTPQYPLWTDGARKQRWIYLPPGAAIDGGDPDAWQFPVGTRLWKELAFDRRAETRYMERTTAGWRYATYVWTDDGRDAILAPARGAPTGAAIATGALHRAPSESDCRACHAGPTQVLGFSALQLSPDRDPGALHREPVAGAAVDLRGLVAGGQLRGYPAHLVAPRIAARSPLERSALGYLHGNCGGCHRADGPLASVGLVLAQPVVSPPTVLPTAVDQPSRFTLAGATTRIAPGDPARSVVIARVRSRDPAVQMPALGTQLVDDDAVRLLSRWIHQLSPHEGESR